MNNILTVDLEEWYHPEYVKNMAPKNTEERITHSLTTTLQLLDKHNVNATFFVVGESVEKHPELLDEINEKGHEIAFHGYYHKPLWQLSAENFRAEIKKFNSINKGRCLGFRAPSFSLNNQTKWALEVLEEEGFHYDSSIFPVKTPLYGVPRALMKPYKPSHKDVATEDDREYLWEFPLLAYPTMGLRFPVAGGFYLRLLPLTLIKRAIKKMNKKGVPAVIYVHNWELDLKTPRLKLSLFRSFVTYYNTKKTKKRIGTILSEWQFTSIRDYLHEQNLA